MMLIWGFPWLLAALLALPGLWWLLKAVPPPPRPVIFPPVRLLRDLPPTSRTPAQMPVWLLMVRMLLLACLIVAAAGPVLTSQTPEAQTTGPLLIAFDDDWSTASDWPARRQWIEQRLHIANRQGRSIYLVPTAPPLPSGFGPFTAQHALTLIQGWQPKPWSTDRLAALNALPALSGTETVWVGNGLEDGHSQNFTQALSRLGNGPSIVVGQTAAVLTADTDLTFTVRKIKPGPATLIAVDDAGHELGRTDTDRLTLPTVLRNQVSRVTITGESSAAATVLMDESSRRRLVALAEDQTAADPQPLLDTLTYVEKAVQPFAELKRGLLSDLLAAKPSVLVLATELAPDLADDLRGWIQSGGLLIRFASPALTQNPDEPLLPARLHAGGRQLGGVLSWAEPQQLAPFPADSPFAPVNLPADIWVKSQILADPDMAPATKVWARLADGTPLVTAQNIGRGWLVLFHTAANPHWSSLPLSGAFPQMLHQLVMMSAAARSGNGGALPPVHVLDGFGHLQPPPADTATLSPGTQPGPGHPPGFYGDAAAPTAFNLGPFIRNPTPYIPPAAARVSGLQDQRSEVDLRPVLLLTALGLGLVELLLTWRIVRLCVVVMLATAATAHAQQAWDTRLAYMLTGNAALDRKSQTGLQTLTQVVAARSTANLAAPQGVAPDSDDLAFYPLIYWPLTADSSVPSPNAAAKLKRYLKRGGMIVFDRQDGGAADPAVNAALRRLNAALDLPPLQPMGNDHVLTHSYYLIHTMPGRFTAGTVWVQTDSADNDGVATVILGSNDWAGEWAGWGDSPQMEAALRFGVNLCIYALTGNYKADQVHMPALLERLGRQP